MRSLATILTLLAGTSIAQAQNTAARLFLGNTEDTPTPPALLQFTSLTDVGNKYGTNSENYKLAQGFYAGTTSPPYYLFLKTRMPNLPARAHLYGSDIQITGRIASIEKVTAGKVALTVNGYPYVSSPLNFKPNKFFPDIGLTLQNGLNANLTPEAVINATHHPTDHKLHGVCQRCCTDGHGGAARDCPDRRLCLPSVKPLL